MDNPAHPDPSQELPAPHEKLLNPPPAGVTPNPAPAVANAAPQPSMPNTPTPPPPPTGLAQGPLPPQNPVVAGAGSPPTFWQKHGTWINWLLFIVLIIELIAGGLYAHSYSSNQQNSQAQPQPTQSQSNTTPTPLPTQSVQTETLSPTSTASGDVVCTTDAQQCPDGSWVGRTGPNCEFACPTR